MCYDPPLGAPAFVKLVYTIAAGSLATHKTDKKVVGYSCRCTWRFKFFVVYIENNVYTLVINCFCPHRVLFWYSFPSLLRNSGNKNQNNPLMSVETVRHQSTYIILFLTLHYKSINDDKTTIFIHLPRVSLARFSFCWWRHNRLLMTSQWPGNYDAITWIAICNSLDIDFIHGDIHDRSCKKFDS